MHVLEIKLQHAFVGAQIATARSGSVLAAVVLGTKIAHLANGPTHDDRTRVVRASVGASTGAGPGGKSEARIGFCFKPHSTRRYASRWPVALCRQLPRSSSGSIAFGTLPCRSCCWSERQSARSLRCHSISSGHTAHLCSEYCTREIKSVTASVNERLLITKVVIDHLSHCLTASAPA